MTREGHLRGAERVRSRGRGARPWLALCLFVASCAGAPRRESAPPPSAGGGHVRASETRVDAASELVVLASPTAEPSASLAPEPVAPTTAPSSASAPLVARSETRAVVLGYHDVGPRADDRTVSGAAFEAHMEALVRSGVSVVPLSHLVDFLEDKRKLPARVVTIMFDDGDGGMATHALPVLERLRLPFSLALPTASIDFASSPRANPRQPKLTWPRVRAMMASGLCEVASHGHTHSALARMAKNLRREELGRSRELIGARTGLAPSAFVYPMGSFSEHVITDAEALGYRAAFTAVGKVIAHDTPRFRVPRFMVKGGADANAIRGYLRVAGLLP
jgi:peptidoglycan/xylan/chitin deacetylase (PgdA/CDA1 family)